jgi:hypothetical protein
MGVGAWTCETATTDSPIATNAAHSRSFFFGGLNGDAPV